MIRPEQGLPEDVTAERFVLGSVILNDGSLSQASSVLIADDFSIEKHKRIFAAMLRMRERGEKIERGTLFSELSRLNESEMCGGLAYLVDLDNGIPQTPYIDGYVEKVKRASVLRKIIFASRIIMDRAILAEDSPEEIIAGGTSTLRDLYTLRNDGAETVEEIVEEAGGPDEFFKAIPGIPTPWANLTTCISGWQESTLTIVAARPSMGKTSFAMNAIWNAACRGITAALYTAEMSKREIVVRYLSFLSGISFNDITAGELTKTERFYIKQALDELAARPLRIIESGGRNVMSIRSHAERTKERFGLGFMAYDYIGMFRLEGENKAQELGAVCREFKLMASSLKIPVMLLSQLNRKAEGRGDHRPMMSDLRDSGNLEEHADLVILLHRPEYYAKDDQSVKGIAEVIIGKQRNGDTPTLQLIYRGERFRFEMEERNQ